MRALMTGHFMNTVVMIDVGGKPTRTLPKDVAFDVVSDRPIHVDFLRISEHATSTSTCRCTSPTRKSRKGIKIGGVLNIVRHELELICDAAEIPGEIAISLKGLEVGEFDPHFERRRCPRAPSRRSTTATSPSRRSSPRRR